MAGFITVTEGREGSPPSTHSWRGGGRCRRWQVPAPSKSCLQDQVDLKQKAAGHETLSGT